MRTRPSRGHTQGRRRSWLEEGIAGDADGLPTLSWFGMEQGYWAARRRRNLLLVHYRDLKADLAGEMRRIAQFLSIDVPETLWLELVAAASFEAMRRHGDELQPNFARIFEGGAERFFQQGLKA